MTTEEKYWLLANKAAKETGWKAETIFTQWQWETAHFTSSNLRNNNNIAGQTYYSGCGYPKGTARPKAEGGYYIKYSDAAKGYVDFIKKNHRYDDVKLGKTVEEQIDRIAANGWAADKNYAKGLKSLHGSNISDGIYKLPKETVKSKATYPGHLIKEGSTDKASIKKVQVKVDVKVDGEYGPKTTVAVCAWQKAHGLVPDGEVGKLTWDKMF